MKKTFALLCLYSLLFAEKISVPKEIHEGFPVVSEHPGQYPLIGYTTFRKFCADIVIDESTEWFDPDTVMQGDVIYLNYWYLYWFVNEVHDKISHPYILLTCDRGAWAPPPYCQKILYDPKLAAWFGRNIVFSYHPKCFQIPMGPDMALFDPLHPDRVDELFYARTKIPAEREHLLYLCFAPRKWGDRDNIVKMLDGKPFCLSRSRPDEDFTPLPLDQYYEEISHSKFVVSPIGWETDCVRTWEALSLGAIPVVEHTFLDPLFDRLPLLKLHAWDELTEELLITKYEELKNCKFDDVLFDPWMQKIKAVQRKVRLGDLSFASLEATLWTPPELANIETILTLHRAEKGSLIYKGFFSSIRPYQIANAFPSFSQIYLRDPYINGSAINNLKRFVKDLKVLDSIDRIYPLFNDSELQILLGVPYAEALLPFEPPAAAEEGAPCVLFLDLAFYRTSLFVNFWYASIGSGNFRHSLKSDLILACSGLPRGALIMGNMAHDAYVAEVLKRFSKETGVQVEVLDSFWYFTKPKGP